MKSKWIDLGAGLSYIAGGGLAVTAIGLSTAFPTYSTKILAWSGIAIGTAGLLVRLFFNRTGAAAPAVLESAPVLNASGEKVAMTVSTTSTLPIAAPTSGGVIPKP